MLATGEEKTVNASVGEELTMWWKYVAPAAEKDPADAAAATAAAAAAMGAAAATAASPSDQLRQPGRRRGGKALQEEFLPKLQRRQPRFSNSSAQQPHPFAAKIVEIQFPMVGLLIWVLDFYGI
jgi:hypothetical protein